MTLAQDSVSLAPGESTQIQLAVQPLSCEAESTIPFTAHIESNGAGSVLDLNGQVSLVQAPSIMLDTPGDDATSGARTVHFYWRTAPATTGTLTIYPLGDPGSAQSFNTPLGTAHSVQVDDLDRDQIYDWYVEATSACGTGTSAVRSLTIGNGIVFATRDPSFTIDRDYDQRINVIVRNDDVVAHTLTASVQNPHPDLIVNFVGSGSVDQTISLAPGESKTLDLAVHAQDTAERNYDIVAVITADEEGIPLTDTTTVHLRVLAEFDVTLEEVSVDPVTGTRHMRVTNHGKPISDLHISAIDPVTGEPARVYMKPDISHALLKTDQSLTFDILLLFDERDVPGGASFSTIEAKPWLDVGTPGEIDAQVTVEGAGESQSTDVSLSCPSGNVWAVTLEDVCLPLESGDWYCTNRQEISMPFTMPYFVDSSSVNSADLSVSFNPGGDVRPHSTSFSFNGTQIGTLSEIVPQGEYSTRVPTESLNYGVAGPVVQNLDMRSVHTNGGHYIVATDFVLGLGMDSVTGYVCGGSQVEAQQSMMDSFGFEELRESENCSRYALPWYSSLNSSADMCTGSAYQSATINEGQPINTRTGGYDYSFTDLSIPTSAGPIEFTRWYASMGVDVYTDTLGYGWTHSLDTRLIFPEDPGGVEGSVLMKTHSANQYEFFINEDGTYSPYPGLCGTFVRDDGPPITYIYTDNSQRVYTFNDSGQLISLADTQGNTLHYVYESNRLSRVVDDTSQRYLALTYDTQGRVESVSDHTGREVTFSYDSVTGDLDYAVDILGNAWEYTYDEDHHLTEVVDPRGITVERTEFNDQGRATHQYNGEGDLIVALTYNGFGTTIVHDARGNSEEQTYNSDNAIDRQIGPLGAMSWMAFDPNFRLETITDPAGATTSMTWSETGVNLENVIDALGNQTNMTYDSRGNLIQIDDPRGYTMTYTYDGSDLTESTDALGFTTTFTYTAEGDLASVTDPLGNTTTYEYDVYGQRTSMTDALGNKMLFRYDSLGRLIETEDALGWIVRNDYDDADRVIRTTVNYDPSRAQNEDDQYNIVTEYVYDSAGWLLQVIDTYGRSTSYEYDDAGRVIESTDALGNSSSNEYDAAGNLIATTDALGNTASFDYDELDRLISTTNSLGNVTSTAYNADGTVASITDPLGRTTNYVYDDLKRLVSVTDPAGNTSTTSYDEVGNVIASADRLGRTTTYVYDPLNRLIKQTDPKGGVTEYEYDPVGNLVRSVDPNGNETAYSYDDLYRLLSVTDALGNVTSYYYDALGNRLSTIDALGNSTSFAYDSLNRLVRTTDALGNESSTTYDALGNVLSTTDAIGNTTTFDYDDLNRLVSRTDGLGGMTSYTYDALGNQLTMTDANGNATAMVYDALSRPISVTDPNGILTASSYDSVGNLVASADGLGNATTSEYDELNHLVRVVDPLGNITTYTYDAIGNQTSMVDANSVVTRYEYDMLNRLVAVVENYRPGFIPNSDTNVRTEYEYDAVGNRLVIRDANGNGSMFTFDALNRVVTEADALGNTTTYAYDPVDNRVGLTDANGFTTTFGYDAVYRMISIDYPDPDADVSFTYDGVGNRLTMIDGVGTTTWTYDALYRVTSVTDPFGDTVSYDHDPMGNRISLTYPDGKAVDYQYDAGDRLIQVADWDSNLTRYSYDAANRVARTELPNGVISNYTYDQAGRLTGIGHIANASVLSSFLYTYDSVGNRVSS